MVGLISWDAFFFFFFLVFDFRSKFFNNFKKITIVMSGY